MVGTIELLKRLMAEFFLLEFTDAFNTEILWAKQYFDWSFSVSSLVNMLGFEFGGLHV